MKMRRFTILAACLLVVGVAGRASAYDFTFTIPLQFTNLPPEVASVQAWCYVFMGGTSVGPAIGTANRNFPISGGAYSGDVTIQFNADAGRDPATATRYQCGVYFLGAAPVGGVAVRYFECPTCPRFPLTAGATLFLDTGVVALP